MRKVKGEKRGFIREMILNKLEQEGAKGLKIYEASVAGPDRSETVYTSTASKILEAFKANGLATREEEGFRGAKPYTITPLGKDVLAVVTTVSNSRKKGQSITVGALVEEFGEEKVNKAILACLLRYRVPPLLECEAVNCMTRIGFLDVVSSAPLRKRALVIR